VICGLNRRTWINHDLTLERSYGFAPQEQEPMNSGLLGEIIETKSDQWKVGDRCITYATWSEILVLDGATVHPAPFIEGESESIGL
jgi:NADPH-dependent curcumin reductase CurA